MKKYRKKDISKERITLIPALMSGTPSHAKKIPASAWGVVVILSSVATMVMYAETMLVPAIPDLIRDFGISYSTSSWILTTYLISGAVMTPIAGKLSDIYGKKKILLIIMLFYTTGVSIAGFSTNIDFMLLARAFQGVGIAMFPIAFSIVRAQFPREKMAIGQGIITSMYGGGAVIGLSIGGAIIQHYSWHATFFTIIAIAIMLLFTIWRFVHVDEDEIEQTKKGRLLEPQQRQTQQQQRSAHLERYFGYIKRKTTKLRSATSGTTNPRNIDVKGAVTLAVAITSFLLVLTFLETGNISTNKDSTSNSSTILILIFLAAGVISLGLFILIEKRSASPLIDFSLLLNKRILLANLVIIIVGFSMFTVYQTISILVQNPKPVGFSGDPISATMVQLPFALIILVFGSVTGLIITRFGTVRIIIMGTVLSTIGFFALAIFHSTEFLLSLYLGILGIGISLSNVGAQNVIVLSVPRQNSGMSLGMTSFLRIIGSSVGTAVAGTFLQQYQYTVNIGGTLESFPSFESYSIIFFTAAISSLASVAFALILFNHLNARTIYPKKKAT